MAWKLTPEADAEIMKWFRDEYRRDYRMKNYNDILSGILEDIFRNNQNSTRARKDSSRRRPFHPRQERSPCQLVIRLIARPIGS